MGHHFKYLKHLIILFVTINMAVIPDDLYTEILRCVPVESLLRFRSVCKAWRSIIDDPDFSRLHIHGGLGDGYIITRAPAGKLYAMSTSNLRMDGVTRCKTTYIKCPKGSTGKSRMAYIPASTCHGFLLIADMEPSSSWVIWNPCTGESVKLPICDIPGSGRRSSNGSLFGGIGYDEAQREYKVVKVVRPNTFVCSANSSRWREIEKFPDDLVVEYGGVTANGALHWVGYPKENGCKDVGWIIALDLSTETYRRLPLPSAITEEDLSIALSEAGGKLFLRGGNRIIWMLTEYGGTNTWVETISLAKNGIDLYVKPLAYSKCKKEILLYCDDTDDLMWYNMETECLKNVEISGGETNAEKYTSSAFPASLIRIKRNNVQKKLIYAASRPDLERPAIKTLDLMITSSICKPTEAS